MNFHSDEWIMDRMQKHYNEALKYFPEDRIVCLVLQGSQNYGLDTETSDVDTKLIVVPTFHDIATNKQPVSTTHVMENNEHIDFKDLRLYVQMLRKQNINFVEALFSPYTIVNPIYLMEWNRLVDAREAIARYDESQATNAMRGTAHTKYKQIFRTSDVKKDAIEKFGYSPKELYQLLRTEEFVARYINGEPYADCLHSKLGEWFKHVKSGAYCVDAVRVMAGASISQIDSRCDKYLERCSHLVDSDVSILLDDVQYNIMKTAIKKEIG